MAKKVFQGDTSDATAPILGASYWKEGLEIQGTVIAKFDTQNGPAYNINLAKAITVDGAILKPPLQGPQVLPRISIGNMKGFEMAIRAAGTDKLLPGDVIRLKCTGTTPTDKGNDMVNFKIRIEREEIAPQGSADF